VQLSSFILLVRVSRGKTGGWVSRDVSNPCWRKQENSVTSVLGEIGAGDKPIVRVFNKLDLLNANDAETLKYEAAVSEDYSVGISSLTGEGLGDFVAVVEDALSGLLVPVELEIPYSCGNEINHIHEVGSIEMIDYREKATFILGRVPRSLAMKLQQYSVAASDHEDDKRKNAYDEIDWVALGKGRHERKPQ
jgi:GTP-binding protein HflX